MTEEQINELLGNEISVGREMMCRDAERHAYALRYVDGLLVECIELSLRNMPGNEIDGPLHWRLRKGREKLRAAVESLERGYMVECITLAVGENMTFKEWADDL